MTNTLLVLTALALIESPRANAESPSPKDVIQTFETNFGVHHGYRRNHAKGFCAMGQFVASSEARAISRSPLFDGRPHAVIARFSSATGLPAIPDTTEVPHGLGLQFELANGIRHNMSMINVPIFPAATPEAFHESLKAGTKEALAAYQKKYPESEPFFSWLGAHQPPASVATTAFYSLNAFDFVNAKNKSHFVRWQFVPEAGEREMTAEDLAKASPDFLETEFKSRVGAQPARWTMQVTLAEADDSRVDATKSWPPTRKTVNAGTLTLDAYAPQAGGPCDKINFDPNRLSDGVRASADPILKFRSAAYAISFGKRLSDPKDPAADAKATPRRPTQAP